MFNEVYLPPDIYYLYERRTMLNQLPLGKQGFCSVKHKKPTSFERNILMRTILIIVA